MTDIDDRRSEHLSWIEPALRAAHPDLPRLEISSQVHAGPPDRVAFVVILGVDQDAARRRRIRAEASDLLRRLVYIVEVERGRDAFDIEPVRPVSAHDRVRMLRDLRAACAPGG